MVYFKDVYFVLIMIIFKAGVVIYNFQTYKKDNKFTLVYFMITLFFFVSYLILQLFNERIGKVIRQFSDTIKEGRNHIVLDF